MSQLDFLIRIEGFVRCQFIGAKILGGLPRVFAIHANAPSFFCSLPPDWAEIGALRDSPALRKKLGLQNCDRCAIVYPTRFYLFPPIAPDSTPDGEGLFIVLHARNKPDVGALLNRKTPLCRPEIGGDAYAHLSIVTT